MEVIFRNTLTMVIMYALCVIFTILNEIFYKKRETRRVFLDLKKILLKCLVIIAILLVFAVLHAVLKG